jgi:hypothetical protein
MSQPDETTDNANSNLSQGLREELKKLLEGGQAHAGFDVAVKEMPAKLRGVVPEGLPYSAWQIVEHIRIAQRDILAFSDNAFSDNATGKYQPMRWPDDYWPENPAPPSSAAWDESIRKIGEDRKAFEDLLQRTPEAALVEPFAWGDGQTLLREALLIADHTAYHTGELVVVRRLLGAWKK